MDENLRQIFSVGGLEKLAEFYWRSNDWEEKMNLIYIIMDNRHPLTMPIMEDALNIPENITHDGARWARAVALAHPEDSDNIEFYYEDDERITRAIAERRAKTLRQRL